MTEIAQGNLGTVGKYDVKFEKGKLKLEVDGNVTVGTVGVNLAVDSDVILDAIAAAIPGHWDDAVIALAKAALKAAG